MTPEHFFEMNRRWAAHTLVVNLVRTFEPFKVIFINAAKSLYFGTPVKDLGSYGRRKFENLFVFEFPQDRLKFEYE